MVQIGELGIGFFYTKDKSTLEEIDGVVVAKAPCEYANTASVNVVALLDKSGNVLDVDDIPCDAAYEACGEQFVAFVRGGGVTAFLVDPFMIGETEVTVGAKGELSAIEVISDSLTLRVLTIANNLPAKDVVGGEKYLLLVTNGCVTGSKRDGVATVSCAKAAIFDIPL